MVEAAEAKKQVPAFQHFSLPNHRDARVATLESIDHQKCPHSELMSTVYVVSSETFTNLFQVNEAVLKIYRCFGIAIALRSKQSASYA